MNLTDTSGYIEHTYRYDAFGNELEPDTSDSNPFRYCGEYYDGETGSYYLRARYYDPVVGRFTQQDSYSGDIAQPLSLNYYAYCYNNPVQHVDRSGNVPIDTILDIVSLSYTTTDFLLNPSKETAINFLWDLGATFIPYVPGSYADDVVEGAARIVRDTTSKNTFKVVTHLDAGVDALQFAKDGNYLIGLYKEMKKYTKGYGHKIEAHHLLEQRFCDMNALNLNTDDMISAVLTKEQHNAITKRWNDYIPKGTNYSQFNQWSAIREYAKGVYEKHPELFQLLDEYMTKIKK